MEAFVARSSRGRIAALVAGSLAFVPLSLWMAGAFGEPPKPGREWIGWIGAPVFSLFAVGWGLRLRDNADQIVIDDRGLTWRSYSDEHIPWSGIEAIEPRSIRSQAFFAVLLRDPKAHPPTRLLGRIAAAQRGFGHGDFAIGATGTDRSSDELGKALFDFWEAARQRP